MGDNFDIEFKGALIEKSKQRQDYIKSGRFGMSFAYDHTTMNTPVLV